MKNWILFLTLVLPLYLASQAPQGPALVYKPTLNTLLHYAETEDEAALLDSLQKLEPLDTFFAGQYKNELPAPAGVYILVYTEGSSLRLSIHNQKPLQVSLSGKGVSKRLYVFKDSAKTLVAKADVYLNGKNKLNYLPKENAFAFWAPFKDNGRFVIVNQGVPTWVNWRDNYNYQPSFYSLRQWYWRNSHLFNWLLGRSYYEKQRRPYRNNLSYLATNKPLYRLGDTLQLKAYLLKGNNRPQKKPVYLQIKYYNPEKRQQIERNLDTLNPYRPGAYAYSWRLPDSLLGKRVTLNLLNQKDQLLQTANLAVEDYTLEQVKFTAKMLSENKRFSPNQPLKLKYKAVDDLGFSPLQGVVRVKMMILRLSEESNQAVFVLPNILLDTLLPIDATGHGLYPIPIKNLPPVQAEVTISATYQSVDGERHEERFNCTWLPRAKRVHLKRNQQGLWVLEPDSLFKRHAQKNFYLQTGKAVEHSNPFLQTRLFATERKISLPYTFNAGLPQHWQLSMGDSAIISSETHFKEREAFSWFLRNDTLLYYAQQPGFEKPLLRVLGNDKKLEFSGYLQDTLRLPTHYRYYRIYHLNSANYRSFKETLITLKYKLKKKGSTRLNLKVEGPQTIFPGDSATWHLQLKKNQKPVADYDLVALAYKETQFENTAASANQKSEVLNLRIKSPSYKWVKPAKVVAEETDLNSNSGWALIDKQWHTHLGADTLAAFKYMFPKKGMEQHQIPLAHPKEMAQFAPFIYSGGHQYTVRYFSLNTRPYYIKDVSTWGYSAQAKPGTYTAVVRTNNHKITIPGILLKAGYKTELALDLNQLPDSVIVEKAPYRISKQEAQYLSEHVARIFLPQNAEVSQGIVKQKWPRQQWLLVGPFAPDEFKVSTALGDTFRLVFKGGTTYQFDAENKLLKQETAPKLYKNLSRAYPYYNQNQWPGFILKKPQKFKALHQYQITIPVNPLPTAGPSAGSYIRLIPSRQQVEFFVHHLSSGSLYKVDYHQVGSYNSYLWPGGSYQVYALNQQEGLVSDTFNLEPNSTAYVSFGGMHLLSAAKTLRTLKEIGTQASSTRPKVFESLIDTNYFTLTGPAAITCLALDAITKEPIPFANIKLVSNKKIARIASTDFDGKLQFKNLPAGEYTLKGESIGYAKSFTSNITLSRNQRKHLSLYFYENNEVLSEVAILYEAPLIDAVKTSKVTSAVDIQNMTVRDITSVASKAAGVTNFRGSRANGNVSFVDGIKVRGSVSIPQAAIALSEVTALDSTSGAAGFNDRASALSQTQLNTLAARGGGLRQNFKDYAFFIPNVSTNTLGQAQVKVQYPDDKANWSTYFVGMGSGGNYAFSQTQTLAYSPVSALLATPRFLHPGDSCVLIGKTLNYLDTALSLNTYFTCNGDTLQRAKNKVENALIENLPVVAKDSLSLTYTLGLANGFTDGEKRQVSILPNGLHKQVGHFFSLKGDTSVVATFDTVCEIQVGLMQSTTQFLLEEVELQLNYAHYCNEQMASKLSAILALNEINAAAKRKEEHERQAKKLIKKLLANHNGNQLWGWWGQQQTNHFMTAYVLNSLLEAKAAGYEVDITTSLKAALATLPEIEYEEKINLLYLFSQHDLNAPFRYYLAEKEPKNIPPSVKVKRALIALQQGLPYDTARTEALFKPTTLGHYYLPKDGDYRLQGDFSNTLLAAQYFKQRGQIKREQACLNYMVMGRGESELNTIERAALIKALRLTSAATDTSAFSLAYQIDEGPVQELDTNKSRFKIKGQKVRFIKKGEGYAFASATRQRHYLKPASDSTHFSLKTSWEKPPQVGELNYLILEIEPNKSAAYLMVEVALPGGCTVAENQFNKAQGVYQEVRGNKVYLYLNAIEDAFSYKLPVLPRFAGNFTLNPAQVELMYFPTFSGNNEMKRVKVKAARPL